MDDGTWIHEKNWIKGCIKITKSEFTEAYKKAEKILHEKFKT